MIMLYEIGQFIVKNCSFNNVTTKFTRSSFVSMLEVKSSEITRSIFSNGRAPGGCANVMCDSKVTDVKIIDTKFDKCRNFSTNSKDGGAAVKFSVDSALKLLLKNCIFLDNISKRFGGGVFIR